MRAFLGLLILALLIAAVLLGLGIGVAFLLRWIMPSVDLGTGMLIGVLAIAISVYFVGKITNAMRESDIVYLSDEDEDDDDGDTDDRPSAQLYPFRRNQSSKHKRRRR